MKAFRILLPNSMLDAARKMCASLASELTVVDPAPVWSKQSRRLVQIDLPDFHSRVLEEVARRKNAAVEVLLRSWIESYRKELEGPRGGSSGVLPSTSVHAKLRVIAEWAELGYKGSEDAVTKLALRLTAE